MPYDKESLSWPIQNFSHPLGLRCIYGFRSGDIIHFINEKGSYKIERHIDNDCCWICLSRIALFVEIRRLLQEVLGSTTFTCAIVSKYLKKIKESSPSTVEIAPIWFKAKNRYIGEKTHIWLEKGQIRLKIVKMSEQDSLPSINTPSITIAYPDPITAELLRNLSLSTL